MYPNEDLTTENSAWKSFEETGSILSYLRYKGITPEDSEENASKNIRDGEPIGYC